MLMSSGIIKLIDFGCAKRLKKNQSSNSIKQLFKSIKGTPYWMSPEVIKGTGHGSKADIWSTGATIFEMVCKIIKFKLFLNNSPIYIYDMLL
jgi:mitogen-activated protein kinase kinase kinase 19